MTTDNKQRLTLGAVIITLLLCFVVLFRAKENSGNKITTTKQAAVSSQTTVDRVKSEYVAIKDKNIQNEKEVAQNAFEKACEDSSNDGDALIAWSELLTRARNANRQRRNGTD